MDRIWGGDASYPGKPYCSGTERCSRCYKTEPRRRTQSGEGAEGGRSTDSTDDSEPVKPGNSVEGKTLTTRKIPGHKEGFRQRTRRLTTVNTHLTPKSPPFPDIKPGCYKVRRCNTGSYGREVMMTPLGSRIRGTDCGDGTRKPKGISESYEKIPSREEPVRSSGVRFRTTENPHPGNPQR